MSGKSTHLLVLKVPSPLLGKVEEITHENMEKPNQKWK